jgi:hypothetical protein
MANLILLVRKAAEFERIGPRGKGLGLRGGRDPADENGMMFDLAAAGGSEDI